MRTRTDRRPTGRPARPRLLALLIALVAVAAVIAGCSKDKSSSSSGSTVGEMSLPSAAASASPPGAKGADSAAKAPSIAGNGVAGNGEAVSKLNLGTTAQIKLADLTVAAKDVNAAAATAIQYVTAAGGGVSADMRTAATPGDAATGSAQLTLKVPPDQLEPTLAKLASLGTERSRQSSSQDVTGQVADVASRVTSAQASIARLQVLFSKATAIGDIVAIEGQLAQRQADLESLQAQQRALTAQTSFATITLSLVPLGAPIVKTKPADRGGFVGGLTDGWHAFTKALGWGLTGVGAVLPFVLLLALIGWLVIVIRRRLHGPTTTAKAETASGPGVVE